MGKSSREGTQCTQRQREERDHTHRPVWLQPTGLEGIIVRGDQTREGVQCWSMDLNPGGTWEPVSVSKKEVAWAKWNFGEISSDLAVVWTPGLLSERRVQLRRSQAQGLCSAVPGI